MGIFLSVGNSSTLGRMRIETIQALESSREQDMCFAARVWPLSPIPNYYPAKDELEPSDLAIFVGCLYE